MHELALIVSDPKALPSVTQSCKWLLKLSEFVIKETKLDANLKWHICLGAYAGFLKKGFH